VARILIAGCGYVGAATAEVFHQAGWEVEGWTHSVGSAQQFAGKPYRVSAVDLTDAGQMAASAGSFTAVVHCASTRGGDAALYRRVYFEGARHLARKFPDARLLFTSSTSVYAQSKGEWVAEESPAEPGHERAMILREAEGLVLAGGGMVARLAGIYGPGRSVLLRRLLHGEALIDPDNDRFVNQVHRDDAAAALFAIVTRGVAGEIYNVADDEPMRQSECYKWLAQKLNRPQPRMGTSASKRKRGSSNKRVSNKKLQRLGWAPKYPSMAEAMEENILPNLEKMPV
jgi:nucleoside-diphosphate-sugar epimerase